VPDPLVAAKTFMAALEANDAEKAAAVCAEDVAIELPGGDRQLEGREGAKQLIRMAPPFVRVVREESVMGTTVVLRGLTRSPGHFANYTTWTFETDGALITHVTFTWRPAN
jgi:ketosteroid isomerase-like protein